MNFCSLCGDPILLNSKNSEIGFPGISQVWKEVKTDLYGFLNRPKDWNMILINLLSNQDTHFSGIITIFLTLNNLLYSINNLGKWVNIVQIYSAYKILARKLNIKIYVSHYNHTYDIVISSVNRHIHICCPKHRDIEFVNSKYRAAMSYLSSITVTTASSLSSLDYCKSFSNQVGDK